MRLLRYVSRSGGGGEAEGQVFVLIANQTLQKKMVVFTTNIVVAYRLLQA
jgi:hypothetical protein